MVKKAVILFSGGLDSTTCLALAKAQGYACYTLSFDYGQTHKTELQAAQHLAHYFQVIEHKQLSLPIAALGGSALTDPTLAIPDYGTTKGIPITYVPARNSMFLVWALAWAEVLQAYDIFIGVNAVDYSGYPDCRPEFIQAFTRMAQLGTKVGSEGQTFTIHTPLLTLDKAAIIKLGLELGVDYGKTTSCYRLDTEGRACGQCDSCGYRKKGFREAGIADPTHYY